MAHFTYEWLRINTPKQDYTYVASEISLSKKCIKIKRIRKNKHGECADNSSQCNELLNKNVCEFEGYYSFCCVHCTRKNSLDSRLRKNKIYLAIICQISALNLRSFSWVAISYCEFDILLNHPFVQLEL